MVKYIAIAVLVLLVAVSWFMFYKAGDEQRSLAKQIDELYEAGDEEEQVPALRTRMGEIEGQRTFNGILLAFLSAGLIGIVFVTQLLPALAQKLTHAVYDSGEMVEQDAFHDARVFMARRGVGERHRIIPGGGGAGSAQPDALRGDRENPESAP
ncbi:hypothetical protein HZ994_11255 [Akkermansiaceae bacterium]|nr:hypothetical protein HZ994_11255 [Akkermansiaceae bacterium]